MKSYIWLLYLGKSAGVASLVETKADSYYWEGITFHRDAQCCIIIVS